MNSKRVSEQALAYFAAVHKLDYVGSFCFSAIELGDILDDDGFDYVVSDIVRFVSG